MEAWGGGGKGGKYALRGNLAINLTPTLQLTVSSNILRWPGQISQED